MRARVFLCACGGLRGQASASTCRRLTAGACLSPFLPWFLRQGLLLILTDSGPRDSLVSARCRQVCREAFQRLHVAFVWMLQIRTQVLMLEQQALSQLSHLPASQRGTVKQYSRSWETIPAFPLRCCLAAYRLGFVSLSVFHQDSEEVHPNWPTKNPSYKEQGRLCQK